MCTLEKRGSVYILTLTGADDHRLNPTLIDSIRSALHRIRSETTAAPSALITTAHGKFFSNGFDLAWAGSDKHRLLLMFSKLKSLVADLLSLPMPTIAAVNGHASAGGFFLALSHDYILMRKDRGFLYMSELDIGLVIPATFAALLRCKVASPSAWRDVMMRSEKLTAEVAEAKGIIDSAHDSAEETVRAAVKLGMELVERKWDGHVYAQNRRTLFGDALAALELDESAQAETVAKTLRSRL